MCVSCVHVCVQPSGERNTPIPGMSRHSQGKHSRFNYKLQRGLVCALCVCACMSDRKWETKKRRRNNTPSIQTEFSPGMCGVFPVPVFVGVTRSRFPGCQLWGRMTHVWSEYFFQLQTPEMCIMPSSGEGVDRLQWRHIKWAQTCSTPTQSIWRSQILCRCSWEK